MANSSSGFAKRATASRAAAASSSTYKHRASKSLLEWFKRHRRSLLIGAGGVGFCYLLYRTIQAHNAKILLQEEERKVHAALRHEAEERTEAQLQCHFENIQLISDSTTLPSVLLQLKSRLFGMVDLSGLTEKLTFARDDPKVISPHEKLQLWQRLKILSFTRTMGALWSLTLLNLFVRVQLNILGRHLYIDTARYLSTSNEGDQARHLSKSCQQKYLACADFLHYRGLDSLIRDIQKATDNVLQSVSLKEPCTLLGLREIFNRICANFENCKMDWSHYVLPDDDCLRTDIATTAAITDTTQVPVADLIPDIDDAKLDQLMVETKAVLCSHEFEEVLAVSYEAVFDGVMEEFYSIFDGASSVPLAKLLPPVAAVGTFLLEHPRNNRFVGIIRSHPRVQPFCALVYSSVSGNQGI